jgi:hypothetical protein
MTANAMLVRTKTGTRIHLASTGTRRTHCGANAPIPLRGTVKSKHCCNVCFGPTPTNFNQYLPTPQITE